MSALECFQGEYPGAQHDQEGCDQEGKVRCSRPADLKHAACGEALGAQTVMEIVSVVNS